MPGTVKKTNLTSDEISSEIDLFEGTGVPRSKRKRFARRVADFLKDEILKSVGNAKSPVSGERFPGLSKSYKEFKQKQNRPGKANLEFTGDMLDAFDVKVTDQGRVKPGVFGSSEVGKADGHNNFSGESTLRKRRFLPDEDQKFKSDIQSGIDEIINEAIADGVKLPVRRLKNAGTRAEAVSILKDVFPGSTFPQIRNIILGDEALLETLSRTGVLPLLGL